MSLLCCRYHKGQAIYLESKDNTKISCVICSVGNNEAGDTFQSSHYTPLGGRGVMLS